MKPKLTTNQLLHYLSRINNGEKGLFEKINNHFELKKGQLLALKFSERLNDKIK
jgi:hypothetical protein